MTTYRITERENVIVGGIGRCTGFKVYKKSGEAYVYDGTYFAPGWNRSKEECARFAEKQKPEELFEY